MFAIAFSLISLLIFSLMQLRILMLANYLCLVRLQEQKRAPTWQESNQILEKSVIRSTYFANLAQLLIIFVKVEVVLNKAEALKLVVVFL